MKRRTTFISICLCICMLMTMLTGSSALPVFAQDVSSQNEDALTGNEALTGISEFSDESSNEVIFEEMSKEDVPEIIGYEAATEKGHIARLKNEEKDLYSVVFRNADGTNTLYMYSDPVKYIDKNGDVKDKSNKVVADNSKSGNYTNGDNDIRVNFPSIIDNGISLSYNDINISMKPAVTSKAAVGLFDKIIDFKTNKKQTDSVKYDKVFGDNTYITYTPTYTGFKEDIILTEYTGQSEFEFTLYTNGLELYKDISDCEGGSLYLRNSKGETVANLGQVIIFTADNGNNSFGESDFVTVKENQEYTVIIKVDPDYLKNPKTVYPVTIDPTITLNTTTQIEDARITIGAMGGVGSGTETTTAIGAVFGGQGTSRMLVKFPTLNNSSYYTFSSLYSSQIISAYIKTYVVSSTTYATAIEAYAYTTSWVENTVVGNLSTWDSYYDTATLNTTYIGITTGDKSISILNTVKAWCNYNRGVSGGRNPAYGLILINNNEGSTYCARTLYTSENANPLELEIQYNPTIAITSPPLAINIGYSYQLSATTNPSGQSVSWTSQNSSIASVSSSGVVTALKAGTVEIIAQLTNDPSITASYTLIVTLPNGVYYIKNNYSYKYMQVEDAGITDGTNVYQYSKDTSSSTTQLKQLWKVKYLGNEQYSIRPMHKLNMGLEISSYNCAIWDIGTIDTYSGVRLSAEWRMQWQSTGYYLYNHLYNGESNTNALAIESASTYNEVNIYCEPYNSSTSRQRWTFEQVTSPPSGVILYNNPSEIQKGDTVTIIAAVYSNNLTIDQSVDWQSSNTDIVTINSSGVITALNTGKVIITATSSFYPNLVTSYILNIRFRDGTYYIKNLYNNEYITYNSNIIRPLGLNSSYDQKWTINYISNGYYTIKLYNSNLYLTSDMTDFTNNMRSLLLSSRNYLDNQEWKIQVLFDGNYVIISKADAEYTELALESSLFKARAWDSYYIDSTDKRYFIFEPTN